MFQPLPRCLRDLPRRLVAAKALPIVSAEIASHSKGGGHPERLLTAAEFQLLAKAIIAVRLGLALAQKVGDLFGDSHVRRCLCLQETLRRRLAGGGASACGCSWPHAAWAV